jgi:hypothetical protein
MEVFINNGMVIVFHSLMEESNSVTTKQEKEVFHLLVSSGINEKLLIEYESCHPFLS